ncbi:hypothetical protein [Kutzneria sp. NPDC051319]|uniref:hypothetical protein n=1 Tax=Kutzneria sp. NPDC051319 TaxID=3155047 RepID=UPI0034135E50
MAGGQQPGRGRGRRDLKTPLLPGNGPLARVPAAAVFGLVLVLFVVGVVVRGPVGAGLLGALALIVLGLLGATWRVLSPADRALRVLVAVILVAVLVSVLR